MGDHRICVKGAALSIIWVVLQNDLEFLRIRSMKQEIMVAPRELHLSVCLVITSAASEMHLMLADAGFVLIVIQELKSETSAAVRA